MRSCLLALALLASCGAPPATPTARPADAARGLTYRDLEAVGPPRDEAEKLDAHEVDADLDRLAFALERAYVGKRFVSPEAWKAMTDQLAALRGAPTTVGAFCDAIAEALWELPDAHLSAKRPFPDGGQTRCGKRFREARPNPSVGPGYAASDPDAAWSADALSVGHATFGVLAIQRFPFHEDPAWKGFEVAVRDLVGSDGLVIDLRGNGGGDDARGYDLARLLVDGPVATGTLRTFTRRRPETLTLEVNVLRSFEPSPHVLARIAEKEKEREAVVREPEWRTEEAPPRPKAPGPKAFQGPIAILVDTACASSCESTLEVLRNHPRARVFGERTAGLVHFGNVGMITLPGSGLRVSLATKYEEYDRLVDKVGFAPDVAIPSGSDAFTTAMAWLVEKTERAKVVAPADYVVPEVTREKERQRLAALGLSVKESPVLERPFAEAAPTRRSLVVPGGWLQRRTPRVVYAPALLADLDVLELAMSRAYGGWETAAKRGFDWTSWLAGWRQGLASRGPAWMPVREAFAPIAELEARQLDNHTTVPLGLRLGSGSQTLLLAGKPGASCTRVRDDGGHELPLDPKDPAARPRAARRWDGEALTPAWYLAQPVSRGKLQAIECDGAWIALRAPKAPSAAERTAEIVALSGQKTDRPALRHVSDRVAYVRFPTFSKSNGEIIEKERAGWDRPNGHEDALVVDLRGNDGGDAAFRALLMTGWASEEDIVANIGFEKRTGASCLYPALRWGYTSYSSWGLSAPLSDAMRKSLQWGLDELFAPSDPKCPAAFVAEHAKHSYREARRPKPRSGKPRVLVVVDGGCGSDCEMMASTLGKLPEATVVGVNTYGVIQFIQPGYSVLPNTRLPFRVALGTSDVYGDGRSVDGHGLDVDVVLDTASPLGGGGIDKLLDALR